MEWIKKILKYLVNFVQYSKTQFAFLRDFMYINFKKL